MSTDLRAKLASIKRFDQLIAFLRDEMDGLSNPPILKR